jgi:hypothetical protein
MSSRGVYRLRRDGGAGRDGVRLSGSTSMVEFARVSLEAEWRVHRLRRDGAALGLTGSRATAEDFVGVGLPGSPRKGEKIS